MENMFLILYPVLRSLEAKGGSWGVMEMFLNVGKSPEGGFCLPTTESELTIMQAKNRRLFMESWPLVGQSSLG